ncbi:MAG: extracellular solute-binding protein, partial [Nitrospirae bacterium]
MAASRRGRRPPARGRRGWPVAALAALGLLLACHRPPPPAVAVWFHTGQPAERALLERQVARYNAGQPPLPVRLTLLPEGSYHAQVQAAAAAGELPDLFEVDGPYLARYVWQGAVRPLEALLPPAVVADLLPSLRLQGRVAGHLYGVGCFDSGLGLYADRAALARVGARLPAGPQEAWSASEMEAVLARLAARDPDGAVLDLKLNLHGEWESYAFLPLLVSAGGGVLDPATGRATGFLDGAASVRALATVQRWIRRGWVDPNLDDAAFPQRRVALAWGGHWDYHRYREALGEDLALLPLPDFGEGSRTGMGSWQWVIAAASPRAEAAAAFLAFLLRPEEVAATAAANGAVPGRIAAVARSPLYREGGPLRLFLTQLAGGVAVPRPATPAYPVITASFQRCFEAVRDGADPAA